MTYIEIWEDEHGNATPHYHIRTDIGQKKIFNKFEMRLSKLLPKGFHDVEYHRDDVGILDEHNSQHMHIYYIQRRFPHNLHITFQRPDFQPIFIEMLQKCFPRTKITCKE